MSQMIEFKSRIHGGKEDAEGSDGRLNVSSRSDARIFYVSRNQESAFTIVSDDGDIAAGDFGAYLKNDDATGRKLFLSAGDFGNEEIGDWKLHYVTGTASGGSALIPLNQNRGGPDLAPITALGGSAISGLTSIGVFKTIRNAANLTSHANFHDAIVLHQGDAIAVEYARGTTGEGDVTLSFFLEV